MKTNDLFGFPCQFPIKIMGTYDIKLENEVLQIVQKIVPKTPKSAVRSKISKTGKYLAITITVEATSKGQLDNLYASLLEHSLVKIVL